MSPRISAHGAVPSQKSRKDLIRRWSSALGVSPLNRMRVDGRRRRRRASTRSPGSSRAEPGVDARSAAHPETLGMRARRDDDRRRSCRSSSSPLDLAERASASISDDRRPRSFRWIAASSICSSRAGRPIFGPHARRSAARVQQGLRERASWRATAFRRRAIGSVT